MTKTLEDYLDDPDLANEPESLRKVHAIRLKIHDDRKGITTAEYNAIVRQRAARFLGRKSDSPQGDVTASCLIQ